MTTYTAFCQDVDGTGTIWISRVEAESVEAAIQEAREECAFNWAYDVENVHCLGLATGDITIVHWEDLGV